MANDQKALSEISAASKESNVLRAGICELLEASVRFGELIRVGIRKWNMQNVTFFAGKIGVPVSHRTAGVRNRRRNTSGDPGRQWLRYVYDNGLPVWLVSDSYSAQTSGSIKGYTEQLGIPFLFILPGTPMSCNQLIVLFSVP
jgi:hypothetical protein